jgi:hypothetical protein
MSSTSKRQQTMAKRNREHEVEERRTRKREKKRAAKAARDAAADGSAVPDPFAQDTEPAPEPPEQQPL